MKCDRATIVVQLTPPGRGAVATLLVDGAEATLAVEKHFRPVARRKSLSNFPLGRIVFGRWGGATGEEIVACRLSEDSIELCCHGGRIAAAIIEHDLAVSGCQLISWQQWVMQNAAGEKLIQAEAQLALAEARTERTAAILLDQLHGALAAELEQIEQLLACEPKVAVERISVLLERAPLGLHLTQPWHVVLAGQPNVGKSSLINALVGYERAIVFDQPGTTRDVVTAVTAIDGWPVELADTAGLRPSDDMLESAGIVRARTQMQAADLLVLVFDLTQPWTADDQALVQQWPKALILFNKCDLPTCSSTERPTGIVLSAATQAGVDELLHAISGRFVPNVPLPGKPVPFTDRQVQRLKQMQDACSK